MARFNGKWVDGRNPEKQKHERIGKPLAIDCQLNLQVCTPHFAEHRSPAHENEALRIGTSRRVLASGRRDDSGTRAGAVRGWPGKGLAAPQRALGARALQLVLSPP